MKPFSLQRGWFITLSLFISAALFADLGNAIALPSNAVSTVSRFTWNVKNYMEFPAFQFESTSFDFWEQAGYLGYALHRYTEGLLRDTAAISTTAAEQVSRFKDAMGQVVSSTAKMRAEVEDAIIAHGLTLDDISDKLSAECEIILDGLKADFPPPKNATHHEQRKEMMARALSQVEESLVRVLTPHGVSEADIRAHFGAVRLHVEQVLVTTGDLIEQHPVILETMIFTVAVMLIPEGWILRPFLSIFGFGNSGPLKGSSAAWAQRTFWGGAVKKGSWFARLQSAGMKLPRFPPGTGKKIGAGIGVGIGIIGSFGFCGGGR